METCSPFCWRSALNTKKQSQLSHIFPIEQNIKHSGQVAVKALVVPVQHLILLRLIFVLGLHAAFELDIIVG